MAISVGEYPIYTVDGATCSKMLDILLRGHDITEEEYSFLEENCDWEAIARGTAEDIRTEFDGGFTTSLYELLDECLLDRIYEDAAYKEMLAKRQSE